MIFLSISRRSLVKFPIGGLYGLYSVLISGRALAKTMTSESRQTDRDRFLNSFRIRLLMWPRSLKQASMIAADTASYVLTVVASLWLLGGEGIEFSTVAVVAALAIGIGLPVHFVAGLYASIVRFMGIGLLFVGLRVTALVSAAAVGASYLLGYVSEPLRLLTAFWAFSLILVVGGRIAARMFLIRRNRNREAVIIYGAGEAGAQLAEALFAGDDYLPVAFVDDKKSAHGKRIHGLRVRPSAQLDNVIVQKDVKGVLLAIPGASRRRRRQVLERLAEYPVRVQTMPVFRDVVSGRARVDDISDVEVGDLLGRDQVPPVDALLNRCIAGKNVLVTGAGGSIGSELCRQILALRPQTLVCFEMSEPALYDVHRELCTTARELGIECNIVALLGSVLDQRRLGETLSAFHVHTVYHAAAYKHVPIVEQNLFEGLRNNVFGTLRAAATAELCKVQTFVLISTDKAVNPTSVMGATKRLAELVLQAMNAQSSGTRFCMVRFGNVLESSGSVVPLFKEQIRAGGPVTVTHRDIIRYFMTIPEAAQLVIQAGSMGHGGDVFVLDMGKPVKIEDLAHRMINLMGLSIRSDENPDGDIEIEYVGLRPAEKLYEELLIGSNVTGTEHPRIMRAKEDFIPMANLKALLDGLQEAHVSFDYDRANQLLDEAVREYSPSQGIDDLIWVQKTGTGHERDSGTIVDFPSRDS